MSSTKRGLGKGFDALIPTQLIEAEFDPTAVATGERGDQVHQLSPQAIDPNPHQPRQDFDEKTLQQLAESIKQHGILQPVVVTGTPGGRYELIAGERRLRAAKISGLDSVPAIVRSFSDQQKLELALIENLQREDLNPIEMATSYRKLVDQFNMKVEDIAKRVGKDSSTISNTMRLLNLPLEAKRAVAMGQMTEGHARVILSIPETEKQLVLTKMIVDNAWTVRQTEEFARAFKAKQATTETAKQRIAGENDMTRSLGDYLRAKVDLIYRAKGGRLIINFNSEKDLKRIFETIKKV